MNRDFPSAAYDAWKTTEPDYADPGRSSRGEDREPATYQFCDVCGGDIVGGAISLQGLGIFCSSDCATQASERHAAAMDPRRI